MEIVVGHGRSRRWVRGTFSLVGHPEDLLAIAEQIQEQVGTRDSPKFSYGTVWISPRPHFGPSNTHPLEWDEGESTSG